MQSISQTKSPVKSRIERRPGCVAEALEVIGDKWTPLIVMELCRGCRRFSALEQTLRGISPRTLSQRLVELQRKKLITKQVYAEMPPRAEYTLTPKGADLIPILKSMAAWGDKYAK